ncbi:MAG: aminoglycoside phosphotransferase family protein [Fimbriimonas sp.]
MREREIARRLADAWGLRLGDVLPGATCSLVTAALDVDGREVVLKVPEADAEEREAVSVLRAFSAHGGVPVLRIDDETGSVLLPRLRPGHVLAEADLTDLQAIDVCADLILRLREAPSGQGLSIESWFAELDPSTSPMAADASRIAAHLFATTEAPRVLHGDLHHFNILADDDDWVAIDPKGYAVDPAFEIAAFMRNPVPRDLDAATMAARIRRFAERLGDPPERLWAWSYVKTVLSSQGHDDGTDFYRCWRIAATALAECRTEFWPG